MAHRVGLVEDHTVLRLGTKAALHTSADLRVVASSATARGLLAGSGRFDVVLLGLALTDGSSPAANIDLLAPLGARILAYTSGDQPHLVREAARAGATGVLRTSGRLETILDVVRRTAQGLPVTSPDWTAALASDPEVARVHLSRREAEVLALYASGETAERVARAMYISRETVTDHIRRIRAKYAAADRPAPTKVDLFRRAVEDGLVILERSGHMANGQISGT